MSSAQQEDIARRNRVYKKKYYRKVLQEKRYCCDLCDVVFLAKSALDIHHKTKKHQRIVEIFDKKMNDKNKGVTYL